MTNPMPRWLLGSTGGRRIRRTITPLHELSDHQLKDIGLRREFGRFFAW